MKKNYIVRLLLISLTGIGLLACQNKKTTENAIAVGHSERDTSLNYLLKPANEQVIASIPVIQAQKGAKIYIQEIQGRVTYDTRNQVNLASRVSGRIEKLYIKYNYQPVKKGQLILELYVPDLAAAQRELLLIKNSVNDNGMMEAAKQRLAFLGMSTAQINQVLRSGQVAYRIPVYSHASGYILEKQTASAASGTSASMPSSAASSGMDNMGAASAVSGTTANTSGPDPVASPILLREGQYLNAGQNIFTIYQTGNLVAEFALRPEVAAQLNKEAKIIIQRTASKEESLSGKIGLVQPVFNAGENFVLVRVYLPKNHLQVGELLSAKLPFISRKGFWLPKEAVLSTGNHSLVFKKEGKTFVPKTIKTGIRLPNEMQILDEIEGWDIARNAYYLIDSESFIKTDAKEM